MSSPSLAITHVAAAQNQKEVTINDAINALDAATQGLLRVDFTAGNVTLTDAQFRAASAFQATNLSAPRDLDVPQIKRMFAVDNVAGSDTLTVKRGSNAIELHPGMAVLAYTDGTENGLIALTGTTAAVQVKTYLLAGAAAGKPAANARVFHHLAGMAFDLPAGLTGSAGLAKTAATDQTDFDIRIGGASAGTMRFAAAATTATFVFATATDVAAGAEIEIIAPATQDATLADITWTLKGIA